MPGFEGLLPGFLHLKPSLYLIFAFWFFCRGASWSSMWNLNSQTRDGTCASLTRSSES